MLADQSQQNCWKHLRKNWKNLEHISNPTQEMYLYAVTQNWQAIKFIPPELQTEQICIECITQSQAAWKYIKITTTQVLNVAVKHYPQLIKNIKNPSEQLQFTAVNSDVRVIKHIKNPSVKLLTQVVEQDGKYISLVSEKDQTYGLCLKAAAKDPKVLQKCSMTLLKKALETALTLEAEYDKLVEENKQLWNEVMYRPGGVGADAALERLKNNEYSAT